MSVRARRAPGPSEHIRVGEEYYLLASAVPSGGRRLLLNHGDSFAVLDESGDVPYLARDTYGLFCRGTRFLSRFELRLNDQRPLILNAAPSADGSELSIYLANADERSGGEVVVQRNTVSVQRRETLIDGVFVTALQLHNYGSVPLAVQFCLLFEADFADLFELRGVERRRRGRRHAGEVDGDTVRLSYDGVDGVHRVARLQFAPGDRWQVSAGQADLCLTLEPGEDVVAEVAVHCQFGAEASPPQRFAAVLPVIRDERRAAVGLFPAIDSDHEDFNEWIRSSVRDLAILRAVQPTGSYLYAGIPWFATIFGRDGLLTAREVLAFAPELAAGTLRTLAALQGQQDNPERDEEPGKILHELRHGEMAATGEVPFGRYYGSIDATPLFLALLAEYADRTADIELVRELWPNARAALAWIERSVDARGYLAYARRAHSGLVNQGWKDSHDAVFHEDGRLAEPPIALCEVQGYVYAALRGVAALARRLGDHELAAACEQRGDALQAAFVRDFWLADLDTYALALDGDGQPCAVVTSNAGHCLFTGIADPQHAVRIASGLLAPDCFCGWGIRTVSARARRYNPMSYHNGSVWPHDNALIAAGLSRYGLAWRAADVLSALLAASTRMEYRRLPELFCGFPRSERQQPVPYPVACQPQAWAAGSVFLFLEAVLGLEINAWERRLTLSQTSLPPWLGYVELRGLRVRDARADLRIVRGRYSAAVEVTGREGDLEIVVRK